MKNKKLTTYQMAVTALMAAALCVLGPLSVPIGAIPISLSNFVICLTAWLLGPKFGTLSVAVYLLIGLVGVPVFSGYGAGIAKLAGPTGGYLVGGDFIQNMNNCHYLPSLASLLKRKRISIASMGVLLITSIWASSSIIGDVKRSSPGDACFSGADFTGAGLFPSSSSP